MPRVEALSRAHKPTPKTTRAAQLKNGAGGDSAHAREGQQAGRGEGRGEGAAGAKLGDWCDTEGFGRQIFGRAGDVFIAHQKLAHCVAPNHSSELRTVVYFRVASSAVAAGAAHMLDWAELDNIWAAFPGVRDAVAAFECAPTDSHGSGRWQHAEALGIREGVGCGTTATAEETTAAAAVAAARAETTAGAPPAEAEAVPSAVQSAVLPSQCADQKYADWASPPPYVAGWRANWDRERRVWYWYNEHETRFVCPA